MMYTPRCQELGAHISGHRLTASSNRFNVLFRFSSYISERSLTDPVHGKDYNTQSIILRMKFALKKGYTSLRVGMRRINGL